MSDKVVERALQAIREVHTDTSVEAGVTLVRLQELRDEVEMLIDAVESDLRQE